MNKGIKFLKNKYMWMLLMGFLLTALLVLTIWITSEPWKTIFNISAMLGSGVFCSALVSWIIEVNNNKAIAKEHERQRKFIYRRYKKRNVLLFGNQKLTEG